MGNYILFGCVWSLLAVGLGLRIIFPGLRKPRKVFLILLLSWVMGMSLLALGTLFIPD